MANTNNSLTGRKDERGRYNGTYRDRDSPVGFYFGSICVISSEYYG